MRPVFPDYLSVSCDYGSAKNSNDVSVLSTLAFYLGMDFHHESLQALILLTGKSMSVAIFDLTSIKRINGLASWMKHFG